MEQWTASNAAVVLNELERRIKLIKELQELIRDKNTDEVHDLQPLFERGLWMFGPEYESVEFTSNRGMAFIVQKFFGQPGPKHYAEKARLCCATQQFDWSLLSG